MHTFYSSCPSGMEKIAEGLAQKKVRGMRVIQRLNGALLYTAQEDRPRCDAFQNTFRLLAQYPHCPDMERASRLAARDTQGLREADMAMRALRFRSFRVMFSDGNALCAVPQAIRAAMEKPIRSSVVDRVTPETELLLLRRTEGFALLLLRLTRRAAADKGELGRAVAACMTYTAFTGVSGVFLDPFAGSGALGEARLALAPARLMTLSDTDGDAVSRMKTRFAGARCPVTVTRADALALDATTEEGSVTEIVTDPPWGLFRALDMPADAFYGRMLTQFARALRDGGRLSLLTADKENFSAALAREDALRLMDKYDVLINGKKAALYVCHRNPRRDSKG